MTTGDCSPARLRVGAGELERLGAALHQAARRHEATSTSTRTHADHLHAAGAAPALTWQEVAIADTAAALTTVPTCLQDAGGRVLALARTAQATAAALGALEREHAAATSRSRTVGLDPDAHRAVVEQLEQLARRRAELESEWHVACRAAEVDLVGAASALVAVERRLSELTPASTPRRVAGAVVGAWQVGSDLGTVRDGLDVRAHLQRLGEGRRRMRDVALEADRRAAALAQRVGRGVARAAATAPRTAARLGAAAREAGGRVVSGTRRLTGHRTVRAVGKRLGPLGLVLSGASFGTAIADGRRVDAAVEGAGLVAGGALLLGAVGLVSLAPPVAVAAGVVAAGAVVYEHREQIAAAGRWVGAKVRGGLRRLRGAQPRCP